MALYSVGTAIIITGNTLHRAVAIGGDAGAGVGAGVSNGAQHRVIGGVHGGAVKRDSIVFRLRGLPSAWLARIDKTVEDYTREFVRTHESVNAGSASSATADGAAAAGHSGAAHGSTTPSAGKKRARNDSSERTGAQRARVAPKSMAAKNAAAAAAGGPAADVNDTEKGFINLNIDYGHRGTIRCKRRACLVQVSEMFMMKAANLGRSSFRVRFDGEAVGQGETADSLELEDGDTLEIMTRQTGD